MNKTENRSIDAIRGEAMHEIADRYESLPKIHGWVARDEDGRLCMYGDKPFRDIFYGNKTWFVERDLWELPKELFPEITWESEPVEVELLIRKV